jgi:hypothetical protein
MFDLDILLCDISILLFCIGIVLREGVYEGQKPPFYGSIFWRRRDKGKRFLQMADDAYDLLILCLPDF